MAKLFRSLLVWLMLLALPVQGFASVTMMACADGSRTPAAQLGHGHDHAAMLAAAAQGAQAQHLQHSQAMADMSGADVAHSTPDHHTGHGALKCGGAACCVGAALSPCLPAVMPALPLASAPVALYSGFLPAVDLAHPERPPQGLRA